MALLPLLREVHAPPGIQVQPSTINEEREKTPRQLERMREDSERTNITAHERCFLKSTAVQQTNLAISIMIQLPCGWCIRWQRANLVWRLLMSHAFFIFVCLFDQFLVKLHVWPSCARCQAQCPASLSVAAFNKATSTWMYRITWRWALACKTNLTSKDVMIWLYWSYPENETFVRHHMHSPMLEYMWRASSSFHEMNVTNRRRVTYICIQCASIIGDATFFWRSPDSNPSQTWKSNSKYLQICFTFISRSILVTGCLVGNAKRRIAFPSSIRRLLLSSPLIHFLHVFLLMVWN